MKRRFAMRLPIFDFYSLQLSLFAGGILNDGWLKMLIGTRTNLRARGEEVNYQRLVQSRKKLRIILWDER